MVYVSTWATLLKPNVAPGAGNPQLASFPPRERYEVVRYVAVVMTINMWAAGDVVA